MGTVTVLRPPKTRVKVTPLRPRRRPGRDRGLDVRLVPGSVVDHPGCALAPKCRAILVTRNPPNADGIVDRTDGIHDWLILDSDDDPTPGDIVSFATYTGARLVRWTPADTALALAARTTGGGAA